MPDYDDIRGDEVGSDGVPRHNGKTFERLVEENNRKDPDGVRTEETVWHAWRTRNDPEWVQWRNDVLERLERYQKNSLMPLSEDGIRREIYRKTALHLEHLENVARREGKRGAKAQAEQRRADDETRRGTDQLLENLEKVFGKTKGSHEEDAPTRRAGKDEGKDEGRDEDVAKLQLILAYSGDSENFKIYGRADGENGGLTHKDALAYDKENGTHFSGKLDDKTREEIRKKCDELFPGKSIEEAEATVLARRDDDRHDSNVPRPPISRAEAQENRSVTPARDIANYRLSPMTITSTFLEASGVTAAPASSVPDLKTARTEYPRTATIPPPVPTK